MKEKGTAEVTFPFSVFKKLTKYDRREKDAFHNALKNMADKLGALTYRREDSETYEQLWLFQMFRIDKKNETVTIQVNERFEFILNNISTNFTRFEMENFTRLSGGYTKELYRHLMQFRSNVWRNGTWYVSMEDFRAALSIPDSYKMTNIDKRILEKAKDEFLTEDEDGYSIFTKFEVEKKKGKKGNKIQSLAISFQEPIPKEVPEVSLVNWLEDWQ
ncbi:replication initiation protein [Enterococcus mundtii]|uniref:replication initiation protein n=3 Tax=Enterococcus mundtii TaxID=53346 RepID=UPI0015F19124|nr:replication initiation protein [Enterococcus mundtii]